MVMDDPWGSPWADEVHIPIPINAEVQDIGNTPVSAPTLPAEQNLTLPWADDADDGFGDWATLPEEAESSARGNLADNEWKTDTADTLALEQDNVGAWPSDWDTAPDLGDRDAPPASGLPSTSAELMRDHSLDLWAAEVDVELTDVAGSQEATTNVAEAQGSPFGALEEEEEERNLEVQTSIASDETLVPEHHRSEGEPSTLREDILKDDNNVGIGDKAPALVAATGPEVGSQSSDPTSRPSSSPSEHSRHGESSQESPRTSFDEEPKSQRPQAPRKVSTKVQELVHHFDGLARKEVEEANITEEGDTDGTEKVFDKASLGEDDEDEDDFGDFEEGQSDDEASDAGKSSSDVSELVVRKRQPGESSEQKPDSQPSETASPEHLRTIDYGHVEFDVDTRKLESIFPADIEGASADKVFIPDSILSDSFTTVEERKTWYRLSRYGTMQKHNTGDDSYVRVSWKQSAARDETLKIVSRWMEEDRLSGRVVLGGGSKGSSAFGWGDQKAATVPLADVFASKQKAHKPVTTVVVETTSEVPREWPKGLVRDRSSSKPRSPPSKARRRSSVNPTPVSIVADQSPVIPLADFGWNSTSSATQKTTESLSGQGLQHTSATSVSSSNLQQKPSHTPAPINPLQHAVPAASIPISGPSSVSASAITTQKNPLPSLAITNQFDDDEWGDMVSTPATPTLPIIHPPHGLRHNKSQSFGGVPPSKPPISAFSQVPLVTAPFTQNHRPTSSLDGVLLSQKPGPAPSQTQLTSDMDIFGQSPPSQTQPMFIPSEDPVSTTAIDPWASADFSFFDTPSAPPPTSTPSQISKPAATSAPPKSFLFSSNPLAAQRKDQRSKEEIEQDRIVQSVVRGLPDLRYMFRR